MDGVSNAASLVALLQLAASVVNYVKNVTGAPVQKRKLLVALVQARGLLSTLVDLTNEVDDEDWSHTIQSLSVRNGPLSTFQDILEQIARKLGIATPGSNITTALNRLRWPFDQTSLQEMIASLEKLKSHFLVAIANDHMRLSMAIRNEVHEVHWELTAATVDTRRRAIVSLSREQELIVNSLSLGNLSGKLDGDQVMKMRAGAEWFLLHNDFKQWYKASPTPSTPVLIGRAGSGKSTICQVTRFFLKAWHQSETDVCVAHFAFDFTQREKLNKSLVLSHIVQQMVLERPYLMQHVAALRVTGGPLSSSESIDLICRARRDLNRFYLILDGLDEDETISRALVEDLLAIEPPLSILVTTRANPDILRTLQDCVILDIDSATFPDRVETVKKILEKDPRIAGYLDRNHENIANAAKLLVERSHGLWIYTNAMITSLAQAETRATFERLLHNPPSSLHEMYELTLDNVIHQSVELAALAKKTLMIILEAAGPVSHLGRDPTEGEIVEACLSSCKGFVISAGEPSTAGLQLQLAHFTVRNYFKVHGLPE